MVIRFPSLIAAICFSVAPVSAVMAEPDAAFDSTAVAVQSVPVKGPYSVFFDFNSAALSPDAVAVIDKAAQLVKGAKEKGASQVIVAGHTDTFHPDAYSLELSERRADAVKAELERMGVDPKSITVVAKGKADLLVDTPDGVKETRNRRATIIVK